MTVLPVVLKTEDVWNKRPHWQRYYVVDADSVTIVNMVPALLGGWNVQEVTTAPLESGWPDMTPQSIVEWMLRNYSHITIIESEERSRVIALVVSRSAKAAA